MSLSRWVWVPIPPLPHTHTHTHTHHRHTSVWIYCHWEFSFTQLKRWTNKVLYYVHSILCMGHHYLCAPILLPLLNRLLLGYLMTRCENQECTNEHWIMQDIYAQDYHGSPSFKSKIGWLEPRGTVQCIAGWA